jgi:non-heme chloroperoxidase
MKIFNTKRILRFFLISGVLFFAVSFTLIFLPVPQKQNIKNYDNSSLSRVKEQPVRGEEKWLTLRDNSKIFYRNYRSGSGTILLLIHGSGSEGRYLDDLASFISVSGLATVITPDLRGHGRSALRKGDIDYIGQLEEDIDDIIIQLRKENPSSQIVLGGHSSGGGLVLKYAGCTEMARPDGYLMFAPYLTYKAPTVRPDKGNWVTVSVRRWVGLSMINSVGISYFNYLPVLFFNRPDEWTDSLQADSYSYRMAVSMENETYENCIRSIDKPAIVLAGDKDESFIAGKYAEVFKPAEKYSTITVIPGAKHLDIFYKQETRKQITEWFQKNFKQ